MKRTYRLIITLCIAVITNLQAQTINGPTPVNVGTSQTYTLDNGVLYSNPQWGVSGGNLTSSTRTGTTYTAQVTWTNGGATNSITFLQNYQPVTSKSVVVNCTTPAIPNPSSWSVSSNACGDKTISYVGTPPTGFKWYWESSPSGLATTNATNTNTPLTATGTAYLKANCGTLWSATTNPWGTVTVTQYPATPSVTVNASSNACGPKSLSVSSNAPAGTWYWQGINSSGVDTSYPATSTSNPYSAAINGSTIFYLRTLNGSCWSQSSMATQAINVNNPSAPNANSLSFCEWETMNLTTTGYTTNLNWYNASNSFIATGPTYTPTNLDLGTYTYNVKNVNGTCESASSSVVTLIVKTCEDQLNWKESIFYGTDPSTGMEKVIGDSKVYYDGFGSTLQSQVKLFTANQILASSNLYDLNGNQTLSTMPAPINATGFVYRDRFVTKNVGGGNQKYSASDFDTDRNQPLSISNSGQGGLGWYYSTSNNLEPNTPITNFPYTRSWVEDGPDPKNSESASPGDLYRMGNGHVIKGERQTIAKSELAHYLTIRQFFVTSPLPVSQNDVNLISNPDADFLTGYTGSGTTLSVVNQNGDNYIKATAAQSFSNPGVVPIGGNISVTAGATYTFKVKGYRVTPVPAYIIVSPVGGSYNIVWPGNSLSSNAANEGWIENTFTVPAGCNTINLGVVCNGTVSGDLFYINSVSLTQVINSESMVYGYKYISTDSDGKKMVSFTDGDGHVMATALITNSSPLTYDYWTYFFYNDIGQLVAKVASNGVNVLSNNYPSFTTLYSYDHLGRLIETIFPDRGKSQYVYNKDGKVKFSQNEDQRLGSRFSYINYDKLGRIIESGEYTTDLTDANSYVFQPETTASPPAASVLRFVDDIGYINLSRKVDTDAKASRYNDYTFIEYDVAGSGFTAAGTHTQQTNTFGVVSKTENANASTWYSYNEFGKLVWTVQSITNLGTKSIDYTYDSYGNLIKVAYGGTASGATDFFYHYYEYDADQRLTAVYTNTADAKPSTPDARYYYYLHGPLKRVELGGNIQGIDYIYNIDGTIKLINNADPALDPGLDGISGSHSGFMKDIFGETLDYNSTDYDGAGYTEGNIGTTANADQYAGNIKVARWHSAVDAHVMRAYSYSYDAFNQLDKAEFGNLANVSGSYSLTLSPAQAYMEDVNGYDKNGNISGMVRKGKTGNVLANYSYNYFANSNKLSQVTGGTSPITYQYNGAGQMTNQTEGTNTLKVKYTAKGLVKEVRNGSDFLLVSYLYDDRGNKVCKTTYDGSANNNITKQDYYVVGTSRNVMAVYELTQGFFKPIEFPIYGKGRIAINKPQETTTFYEVCDHLGNVRGVVGKPSTLTYVATVEDNGNADINNPRVQEMAFFKNLSAAQVIDVNMNHTQSSTYMPTPKYSSWLRWTSGMTGQDANQKSTGPALALRVEAGDKIDITTWAKYRKQGGSNPAYSRPGIVGAIASILGNSYVGSAPGLETVANATQFFQTGMTSAVGTLDGNGNDPNAVPYAYVYYLLYDRSFNFITKGWKRVSSNAGFDAGSEAFSNFEQLSIPQITISEPGYIYVFASNESESTDVWFDDLTITQQRSSIVAGADFYPFGLAMENREITREDYRYGFQGQYSEKDRNIGWNEFELRMYDPRIGRWLTVDPYSQFDSPYVGMGNSPHMSVDPNGGEILEGPGMPIDWFGVKAAFRAADKVIGATVGVNYEMLEEVAVTAKRLGQAGVSITGSFYGGIASLFVKNPTTFTGDFRFYKWYDGSGTGTEDMRQASEVVGRTIYTAALIEGGGTIAGPVLSSGVKYFVEGGGIKGTEVLLGGATDAAEVEASITEEVVVVEDLEIAPVKTLKEQGKELVQLNGGKNSVTLRTATKQIRFDLDGAAHGPVETPHMQVYNKNFFNGEVRSITRASKEAIPMGQSDLRLIRKYLEKFHHH